MKYVLGFLAGFILASSVTIAQEWGEPPELLIPMTPIYPMPTYPTPYSLPPMQQPQWQKVNPC